MIYGFDTEDESVATGSLLVYATWRSRDTARFRITPDVWSQVERFVKAAAKRSGDLAEFIEALKPRLMAGTLAPRAMAAGIKGPVPLLAIGSGQIVEVAADEDQREFLAGVIGRANQRAVLDALYKRTAIVVLLVRDRLERERPLERRVAAFVNEEENDD